ncbi:DoxX family protein [Nonomuraea rubra]
MYSAYLAVTLATIAVNAWAVWADVVRARFVLANSSELGIAESWLPLLAALKAAGAAGLVLGLLGVRFLGLAAAAGLVVFFAGAVVVHVRARVFHNFAYPAAFLALSAGSLGLGAATA